jgi:hypothetical protein
VPPHDDHDDGEFANYIFNELCSFGPGTANIFRRMIGLPESAWSKDENNESKDDKSYLNSSNDIQDPKQSTFQILWPSHYSMSFINCTSSVKVSNGNRW